MPRKVFVAGEILTAADVNTNLMDQAVMVFDDATDRATAIPTPVEGMVTYLKDTDEVDKFDGSAFVPVGIASAILQVVSVTKTNSFATTGTNFEDVTGLSVSLTPTSATSKVLVLAAVSGVGEDVAFADRVGFILDRSGTTIAASTASSAANFSVIQSVRSVVSSSSLIFNGSVNHLDEPNTTSSVTYKVRAKAEGGTYFINRPQSSPTGAVSSITAMEVAG